MRVRDKRRIVAWALVVAAGSSSVGPSTQAKSSGRSARELELRVTSGEVTLVGDLYLPSGQGSHPAVVLTHGSEPGNRSHRGYVRFARAFQRRGIAALVFDKRGVGESTGTYVEAPDLEIPASDVLAWVGLLKRREEVQADQIGVLGWSQGGWVGPLAASKSSDLAFVISISGSGVSPLEQNVFDKTNQFRATGASVEQVQQFAGVIRTVWTYLVTGTGRDEAQSAWDAVQGQDWFTAAYDGPPMMDRETILKHPRMTHFVAHSSYEPAPVLEKLRVPMLAVFGAADTVVPVQTSLDAMRDAFERGGNDRLTVRVVPGADHGLRVPGKNGELRLAPDYPGFVVDWVVDTVRGSGADL